MPDHAARTGTQHAVMTRDVARYPAGHGTLQAASRIYRRGHYARGQRKS